MNKKIIFGVILASLFIGSSLSELAGIKSNVGNTILHDSTSSIFTINKNVYVGGQVKVSSVRFKEYNSLITEGISEMVLNSPSYNFQTIAEEPIMLLDSANGLYLLHGDAQVENHTALGSGNIKLKMKLVTGVLPDTTNKWKDYAHGLSARSRILGIQWSVRDDSLGKVYAGGYNASSPILTGFLVEANNSNISYFLPNLSLNLKRDTIIFLLTYKE